MSPCIVLHHNDFHHGQHMHETSLQGCPLIANVAHLYAVSKEERLVSKAFGNYCSYRTSTILMMSVLKFIT